MLGEKGLGWWPKIRYAIPDYETFANPESTRPPFRSCKFEDNEGRISDYMKSLNVRSNHREEMVEITTEVSNCLPKNESGVCVLFTQHTTCGLTINENADPDVKHDMLLFLRETIPQFYKGFRHFEHNSDAHIKSSLVGSSVTVPFENGRLLLGRWQGIYLCEFDGPRERKVNVTLIKAS